VRRPIRVTATCSAGCGNGGDDGVRIIAVAGHAE
jgi:hypothetical protein